MFKKIIINDEETGYSVSEDGIFINDKTGKELKGTYKSCEYKKISLIIKGQAKTYMVHRLIAATFIPNPNNLPVVDHIDGNKLNNNINNLRWVTYRENRNGFQGKGEGSDSNYTSSVLLNDFKPIPNFSDLYANSIGQIYNMNTKKVLLGKYRNGYKRITYKGRLYTSHRLIYSAFYGEIPKGYVIDHINGKRDDNRIENLRMVTQSENMYNAQEDGHKGQYKVAQYDLQGNLIKSYNNLTKAGKEVGVTYRAISLAIEQNRACQGYIWKRIY